MRPAGSLGDRPGLTVCRIEPIEARIGVGLKNAGVALQMAFGMIAGSVAGVEEHGRGRITAAEWAVIANIDPGPPGRGPTLGQHRHGGVVAVHTAASEDVRANEIVDRMQNRGTTANLVGEGRQAQVHSFAGIALGLAVKRLMLPILLE
jgi:hypothetical protein